MKHPVLALVMGGVFLAACVSGAGLGGSSAKIVMQGAFKVAAPAGYCLGETASREAEDSGIYLMGRCDGQDKVSPALVTLSVGQAGSAAVMAAGGAKLAAFFTSREGRATLSPSGNAAKVRVVQALSADDAFFDAAARGRTTRLLARGSWVARSAGDRLGQRGHRSCLARRQRPRHSGPQYSRPAQGQCAMRPERIFPWTGPCQLFNPFKR